MEFDWTTLLLEIMNFLILIWLLKRFLYRPVLAVVEQRQAGIAATLEQAQQVRQSALALQQQYEARMADWQAEAAEARQQLQMELAHEQAQQRQALQETWAQEAEKQRVMLQNQLSRLQREITEQALKMAARFASRLLTPLADAHLESGLIQLFCDEVTHWPEPQREEFLQRFRQGNGYHLSAQQSNGQAPPVAIVVRSRYALEPEQAQCLHDTLQTLLQEPVHLEHQLDERLMAGLCLACGNWTLGLNLASELSGFAESGHE
jgi:F-type H+-transporting ATPase subunit b